MNKAASACLCGIACRYNGKAITNFNEKNKNYLPICPELLAGLPAPRNPVEIKGEIVTNSYDDLVAGIIKIIDEEGNDYSNIFIEGANNSLKLLQDNKIDLVVLKDCSPSCGCGLIYDGTFSGKKIKGNGIFCDLLIKNKIRVVKEKYEKI